MFYQVQKQRRGILPLSQMVTSSILERFDLPLIGHGKQTKDDCGQWLFKKCDDLDAHNQVLNPEHHGKIAVYKYRRSCHRPSCPVCVDSWVSRATKSLVHRLKHYAHKVNKRPIHVIISPPFSQLHRFKSVAHLRRKAIALSKIYGLQGGSLVYHSKSRKCHVCNTSLLPRKRRCHNCGSFSWRWVFNPHFHFFGFGWLPNGDQIKALFKKYGWIVKNLKIRKTVGGTAWYELSHCADMGDRKHQVLWIGDMNHKNFKCPPLPTEEHKCPICGQTMRKCSPVVGIEDIKGYYLLDAPVTQKPKPPPEIWHGALPIRQNP